MPRSPFLFRQVIEKRKDFQDNRLFHSSEAQPGISNARKQAPKGRHVFLAPFQGASFRQLYPGLRSACPGLLAVAPPARRQPRFPCESENTHPIRAQTCSPKGEGSPDAEERYYDLFTVTLELADFPEAS